MIVSTPVLLRTTVMIGVGLLFLFCSWFAPKKGWKKEWGFPLLGLLGWMVLVVAASVLGAKATASLLAAQWPTMNNLAFRLLSGIGGIGAMWIAAICAQLVGNIACLVQGLPPEKIRWINR
jgi:hypothetical protein